MSSSQNIKKHHKTRIENCKGRKIDPEKEYNKWAYWCPNISGWLAKSCTCKK